MKKHEVTRFDTVAVRLIRRVGMLLLSILVVGAVGIAHAQEANLEQAIDIYNRGEYEKAAEQFSALAKDNAQPLEIRKQALEYAGRAYIARNLFDKAREAIADLLELQPPLIELDPDVEPPPLIDLYYEVRGSIEVPKEDAGLQTIAVMDFRNYAMDDQERWDPMQWGFSSMMIEQLSGATDLKLVDRENLQWILKELDLQKEPGRVDQSTAVNMGKLMGAQAMVFGGIYINGNTLRLTARVVKVETSEILLGESVKGKTKDFYELLEELSLKVARSVNSTLAETEIGARTETKSLDAMRSYSEGLSLLERGEYQPAYEKFLEAQEFDPSYTRAKVKAESLKPMLASFASGQGSSGE